MLKQADLIAAANNPKQNKLTFNINKNNSNINTTNTETEASTSFGGNTDKSIATNSSEDLICTSGYSSNSTSNICLKDYQANMDEQIHASTSANKAINIKDHKKDIEQNFDDHASSSTSSNTDSDENFNSETNVIVSTGHFIAPGNNAPINVKVAFVNSHPIQPNSPKSKLPFLPQKAYYRYLENETTVLRKWLSFNIENNCMYCAVCMAFSKYRDTNINWITGNPVNKKHIYKSIDIHEKSSSHKQAVDAYMIGCSTKSLDLYINNQRKLNVETNRQVMLRIISVILVLAKQDLPFRGHRNESCHSLIDPYCKKGNFLAIIELVAKFDPILKSFVDAKARKSLTLQKTRGIKRSGRGSFFTWLSKSTYNKIIIIIGHLIQKKIAEEVIDANLFSLEIDSTQDVSVMDQLSICIRYVHNGEVQERLLKMVEVKSSTGAEQYKLVKEHMDSLSINLKNLISESFDGAANMSGQYSGLQAHFKQVSPKSVFTHCHAHVLNLIIGDITNCCISSQNLFAYCQQTAVFLSRSYKRKNLWKKILESEDGNQKLRQLKKIGDTRWNSKDAALQAIFHSVFEENDKRKRFICLLEILHSLGYDGIADGETAAEARVLLEKWTQFETILTAFIFLNIFSKATPVSKYLQTKCLDYLSAWHHIVSFKKEIINLSNNFDEIYQQAKELSLLMEQKMSNFHNIFIETALPERRKRKKRQMPGELAQDEAHTFDSLKLYRIEVFRTIFDKLNMVIEKRYLENKTIIQALAFFDPNRFKDINNKILTFDGENGNIFNSFCELIGINPNIIKEELLNFSSSFNNIIKSLDGEFITEQINVQSETSDTDNATAEIAETEEFDSHEIIKNNNLCKKCIPCVLKLLYKYNFHTAAYSNLYTVYKFIATLSCTQVHCERSFSKLKIIKTRLRSSISEELLEPLLLISTERDKIPTCEEILDHFAQSSTELKRQLL